jgi:uncharacterized protein (TIGR02246 family)
MEVSAMTRDEQQIRDLVSTWMEATRNGDTETVLSLITDDMLFLLPGQQSMTKAQFAEAARSQQESSMHIDATNEVLELNVCGDWAYLRSRLTICASMPGKPPMKRAGWTLSILRKENGRWLMARDANLLTPVV